MPLKMKRLFLAFLLVLAVSRGRSESLSSVGASSDRDCVAILNGMAIVEQLVDKLGSPANDENEVARFKDSVAWLKGRRVVVRGYVGKVANQFLSKSLKAIVTVGRSNEQAINVKFLIRAGAIKTANELQVGQNVVFDGRISDTLDLLNDLVIEDAIPVDVSEYERMRRIAESHREDFLGECMVKERPFVGLGSLRRSELLEMAQCANAAYPDRPIPFGYRPLSRAEWDAVASGSSYSSDVYSENGYVIFGDGLRGRLIVDRISGRAVVAWSGCDLSGDKIRIAGGLDFLTCVKHLLKGESSAQFTQALVITKGIAAYFKNDVWVVGHSLGGCITTYVAMMMEGDAHGDCLKFTTFNGLGMSALTATSLPPERRNAGASRLTNVFCTEDPVFNGHRITRWTGISPRHFGHSYYVEYKPPEGGIGVIDEVLWHHSMDEMCRQLSFCCPWYASRIACLVVVSLIVLVLVLVPLTLALCIRRMRRR